MKRIRKKRICAWDLILCLALLFAGCGPSAGPAVSDPVPSGRVTEAEAFPDPTQAPAPQTAAQETLPPESGGEETESPLPSEAPETVPPTTAFVSETRADGAYTVLIGGNVFWVKNSRAIEPDSTLDIERMSFADFGGTFAESYPVSRESYLICAGEAAETEVWHIRSEKPGPAVYIVAGTHGDEKAGWYAGLLLRQASVSCGDLYVLSVANVQGATANRRYVTGKEDLNRSYPGSSSGQAARLAAAIFADIREKKPEIVLDLHEAIVVQEGRDFLGSSLIFTSLTVTKDFSDLFFDLLDAIDEGQICFESFGYTGPAPNGSLNNTVTNELKIPILTVETFRGFPIGHRVEEQLEIAEYVLAWKGMRGE